MRPRIERGRIHREPVTYGSSTLGAPLQVFEAERSDATVLLAAGIHGDEGEGVVLLSAALRSVKEGMLACHVVLAQNPDGLQLGTRGNARGVDLNRNFPASNWSPDPTHYRWTVREERDVELSPGASPGSEPEVRAFLSLLERLRPQTVLSVHAPLACIDDPGKGDLATRLASLAGLPLVGDVGYPTPGSLGSLGLDRGLEIVTFELPNAPRETILEDLLPVMHDVLVGA